MTNALPVRLMDKMRCDLRIFMTDVILYLVAQVAYNKNKFFNTGFAKLIHYDTQNRFASKRNQSLGLRIGVRS